MWKNWEGMSISCKGARLCLPNPYLPVRGQEDVVGGGLRLGGKEYVEVTVIAVTFASSDQIFSDSSVDYNPLLQRKFLLLILKFFLQAGYRRRI